MKRNMILLGMLTLLSWAAFAQNPGQSEIKTGTTATYNWIVPDMKSAQNPMYNSSFSRRRIQTALDEALAGRGMARDTHNPDYLLQFHTFTQRVRKNYYGGAGYPMMGWGRFGWGMPYYGGFGYYGGAYGGGYPYSTTGTDGTLVLDLVDAKSGNIIWQKAISGDVTNPNRLDKQINKGVKKLMKNFPVNRG
ncbi:DUF4136 domain-containing protein [Dyadobacter sandarakinus]|uniref:DUF4136 domain-containing protein n=1 Tax=Dyadobacter sandarakinus TaxID=2747268 RepID=A0ABX7I1Q5_9BACT|nr:DUF4136 domain-containing protein [Dyadobacter sandarakinus]QRR00016.1 DUF4136 domain-containing protein [Dyadobacter sandarakinus]